MDLSRKTKKARGIAEARSKESVESRERQCMRQSRASETLSQRRARLDLMRQRMTQLRKRQKDKSSISIEDQTGQESIRQSFSEEADGSECGRESHDMNIITMDSDSRTLDQRCHLPLAVAAASIAATEGEETNAEFTCNICDKSFQTRGPFNRHMGQHSGQRPHKCDKCKMAFKLPHLLIEHQRWHSNEKPFKCSYCLMSFSHFATFSLHNKSCCKSKDLQTTEGEEHRKVDEQSCEDSSFHTVMLKEMHCDVKVEQEEEEGSELRGVDVEPPFNFHHNKELEDKDEVMHTHFDIKDEQEDDRELGGGDKEPLSNLHHPEALEQRDEVVEPVFGKEKVKEEENDTVDIHRPLFIKCEVVEPKEEEHSVDDDDDDLHNYSSCSEEEGDQRNDPLGCATPSTEKATARALLLHYCLRCKGTFDSRSSLRSHVEAEHDGKNYYCEQCGAAYRNKYNFIVHQRIHSGEKPFECKSCGKSFSQNSKLKRHLVVHTCEPMIDASPQHFLYALRNNLLNSLRK